MEMVEIDRLWAFLASPRKERRWPENSLEPFTLYWIQNEARYLGAARIDLKTTESQQNRPISETDGSWRWLTYDSTRSTGTGHFWPITYEQCSTRTTLGDTVFSTHIFADAAEAVRVRMGGFNHYCIRHTVASQTLRCASLSKFLRYRICRNYSSQSLDCVANATYNYFAFAFFRTIFLCNCENRI